MELLLTFAYKLFWFSIVIGLVAFIHELGHFIVAKMCDVRVDAFAIGMGSTKLISKTIGETEYSIRALPIGGFVMLAQEDGIDIDDGKPDPGSRSFQRKNILQKIAILLAGPFMNLVGTFMILTYIHHWHGLPATTLQVVNVVKETPAIKAGFLENDVLLSIDKKEVRSFEQGRTLISNFAAKEVEVKVQRRLKYKDFNEHATLLHYLEKEYKKKNFIKIEIIKTQKTLVYDKKEIAIKYLEKLNPKDIKVSVSEGISNIVLKVTPTKEGTIGIQIRPFQLDGEPVFYPLNDAINRSFEATINWSVQFAFQLKNMFVNMIKNFKAPENIGGPVAIANVVSQSVERGVLDFLFLIAKISISIGLFNLVPIPGLDGGRIMVIILKDTINGLGRLIFGKKEDSFDDVIESYVNIAGVLCVLSLIVLVTFKDIKELLT
ncbi:MAG: RIP metalloprotease RseP [Candidatus Cloacimonadota bacterium]|nr:MAG: RIP metalloprotease RseP [Candidatus Cloacimonadota bacterium]